MSPCARARASAAVVISALALASSPAHAVKFRRPFHNGIGVNYGFDHNGGGGCTDFHCGGVCYDGHSGTDFPLPLGTDVLAAANGTVAATNNGCPNYGGLGNTCGGGCGNYVRINWADGSSTVHCHLQLNSIQVSTGQSVSCGQLIGRSASSGNSSGPHLHFGFRVGGASRDPFAGGCSQSTSYWTDQGGYPHNVVGTGCEVTCDCSPGEVQNGGCGNCGTHHRTCGGDCHWGGWSGCSGEGECAAGHVDTRSCCDCGSQTRTCSGQCHWGDWGPCAGPDPNGGIDRCETGEPGICDEGRDRCVDGCRKCVRVNEPHAERCDDVDEDCDGTVDNGYPQEMGTVLPKLAARLLDSSYPQALAPGEAAAAWAAFRNEGTQTWERGEIWLAPRGAWEGKPSDLFDLDTWRAFNVAAVLEHEVAPGQTATILWHVRAPKDFTSTIQETFQLAHQSGALLRCPNPNVDVSIRALPAESSKGPEGTDSAGPGSKGGCGCSTPARRSPPGLGWVAAALLARIARRRGQSENGGKSRTSIGCFLRTGGR